MNIIVEDLKLASEAYTHTYDFLHFKACHTVFIFVIKIDPWQKLHRNKEEKNTDGET